MAVTIASGDRQVPGGTFSAVESLTVSTATARQTISVHIPITQIAGSTATSDPNETALFTLPGATGGPGSSSSTGNVPVEGMEKYIKMTSTGPAMFLVVESLATSRLWGLFSTSSDDQTLTAPTGAFVGSNKNFGLFLKFIDAQWQVVAGNATIGTGT